MTKRKPVIGIITPMNDTEIKQVRDLVLARLAEIDEQDSLGVEGQSIVTLDQQSIGRLSRMDALQNQAMAKAQQARRDLERKRLKHALSTIDDGEYGYCEDCGEDIPLARLKLDPGATRCVSCASG